MYELMNTPPTTLAGIRAIIQYLVDWDNDSGYYYLPTLLRSPLLAAGKRIVDESETGGPRAALFVCGNRQRRSLLRWRLLEALLQRVRHGSDRGARSVADGEWRVAMSGDSSRVSRWPERSRAQRGSEVAGAASCASATKGSSIADRVKPRAAAPRPKQGKHLSARDIFTH